MLIDAILVIQYYLVIVVHPLFLNYYILYLSVTEGTATLNTEWTAATEEVVVVMMMVMVTVMDCF